MDIFPVIPASARILWVLIPIGLLSVALVALFAWIGYTSQHSAVAVAGDTLQLRTAMYGREIPLERIDASRARTVDLGRMTDYRPGLRTNGAGLPGFSSGWHRLGNGEKALVVLTRRDRVAYIPTRDGYALLVSVVEPDALIERLRRRR